MGLNKRNLTLIYPNNQRQHYHLADDKVKAKEILHAHDIACAKTYAVITRIRDIKKKWKDCETYQALAIKPANGCGGDGIKIIKKDNTALFFLFVSFLKARKHYKCLEYLCRSK